MISMTKTLIHRPLWHYFLLLIAAVFIVLTVLMLLIELLLLFAAEPIELKYLLYLELIFAPILTMTIWWYVYTHYVNVTPSAKIAYEWDDGPWLLYGKDPKTEMKICWITKEKEITCVEYGLDENNLHRIALNKEGRRKMHVVTLRELQPGTKYIYRICNNEKRGELFHFKTGPSTFEPFSAILVGDTQNGGGFGTDSWAFYSIANDIENQDFEFLMHTGDVSDQGNDIKSWHKFFETGKNILRTHPLEISVGNHDTGTQFLHDHDIKKYPDEGANFDYFFPYPYTRPVEEDRITPFKSRHYYFDYSNCRFIFIDTQNSKMAEPNSCQWNFLENVLGTCPSGFWKVIISHRTLITLNKNENGTYGLKKSKFGKFVVPIFDKYGVDFVISGHAHNYQHIEWKSNQSDRITHYFVSGRAGNKLRKNENQNVTAYAISAYKYLENSSHYMKINFTESTAEIKVFYPDRTILTELKIGRNSNP